MVVFISIMAHRRRIIRGRRPLHRSCRFATSSQARCWLRRASAMARRRFECPYAASPLAQGTTGMLRAAYAYCGLPAFVSLSMAGSDCLVIALIDHRAKSTCLRNSLMPRPFYLRRDNTIAHVVLIILSILFHQMQ